MQVILLKDVKGVGRRHELKTLADGHARFIVAQKMGVVADAVNLKQLEKWQAASGPTNNDQLKRALEKLKNVTVQIRAKANPQGHLFAAIHERDLLAEIKKQHKINLQKPEVLQITEPIKAVGEWPVQLVLPSGERVGELKVVVTSL
jgi:large subunit ribosomal protein L9